MLRFRFILFFSLMAFAGCGGEVVEVDRASISANGLAERINADTAPLVLDVRSTEEFAAGHIPGALNIPHKELTERLGELPAEKSTEIVVYCRSGRRAQIAEDVLREASYTQILDLEGHWQAWEAAELPSE